MTEQKQCSFCQHYDRSRPSYYGETYRCTKTHRFIDPNSVCERFEREVIPELEELIKEIDKA